MPARSQAQMRNKDGKSTRYFGIDSDRAAMPGLYRGEDRKIHGAFDLEVEPWDRSRMTATKRKEYGLHDKSFSQAEVDGVIGVTDGKYVYIAAGKPAIFSCKNEDALLKDWAGLSGDTSRLSNISGWTKTLRPRNYQKVQT